MVIRISSLDIFTRPSLLGFTHSSFLWHHEGMIKALISAALALWTAAVTATAATTQTNVLQNINLQLTIYQQGATNNRRVADQVTAYTTKSLIAALGAVIGTNFGAGAKLVQSTVYSNVPITTGSAVLSNILSTNLALATNAGSYLNVGGKPFYGFYGDLGILVISNNTFITNGFGNITTDIVSTVGGPTTNSVTIDTNAGFITTITPSTNGSGAVTNVAVVQTQGTPAPTESILTNVSSGIDILYGGTNNMLYSVDNYLGFSPISPAEIVVETGSGLDTTNANLASQTGFSIQGLTINYYTPTGSNNLTLSLQGFVKQTLKVDILNSHNPKIVEDIFGANATWNAIGNGYAGGTYTTNPTNAVQILDGYVTNASPIVVEGSINVSFLKNLAQ